MIINPEKYTKHQYMEQNYQVSLSIPKIEDYNYAWLQFNFPLGESSDHKLLKDKIEKSINLPGNIILVLEYTLFIQFQGTSQSLCLASYNN